MGLFDKFKTKYTKVEYNNKNKEEDILLTKDQKKIKETISKLKSLQDNIVNVISELESNN